MHGNSNIKKVPNACCRGHCCAAHWNVTPQHCLLAQDVYTALRRFSFSVGVNSKMKTN